MKYNGTIGLGLILGIAGTVSANGADLPVRTAAPVEYVRVCSAFGTGFFYVPGTDGCLRIAGRVRAEALFIDPQTRVDDTYGYRVRGRIQLDHRTATDYGLLRAFVRMEITRSSGLPYGQEGAIGTSPSIAQAYVQFAGLTAGIVTSMFSNPDLPVTHMGTIRFDDLPDVAQLSYTYSFGNGFSASLSVEDGLGRRQNNSFDPVPGTEQLDYAGQRLPDVVGNVRFAGTWGTVQLSGALHEIREVGLAFNGAPVDTDYGFAVSLQTGFNIPMLGTNDAGWFAATYADGAISYLGFGTYNPSRFGAGLVSTPVVDAFVNPLTGDLRTARGYTLAGGLTHNWTPTVRTSVFGSFARVEYSAGASLIAPAGNVIGLPDFNEWRAGTNTFWTPVSGLNIGAEIIYVYADPRGRILTSQAGVGGALPRVMGSDSTLQGRLRLQRDF